MIPAIFSFLEKMTMSSTEVISSGSIHDYDDGTGDSLLAKSPRRQKRHSPKSSKKAVPGRQERYDTFPTFFNRPRRVAAVRP